MKNLIFLLFITIVLLNLSCSSSKKMSTSDMLELAGWDRMPTQEDFPDYGAVILNESKYDKLYLDSNWNSRLEKDIIGQSYT